MTAPHATARNLSCTASRAYTAHIVLTLIIVPVVVVLAANAFASGVPTTGVIGEVLGAPLWTVVRSLLPINLALISWMLATNNYPNG